MTENATCARVLGCDVGKDSIVMFDSLTGTTQTVDNTLKALTRVLRRFGRDTFVVCEATGGHETALLTAATALGPAHRATRARPALSCVPCAAMARQGNSLRGRSNGEARYAGDQTGKRDTWAIKRGSAIRWKHNSWLVGFTPVPVDY